MFILFYCGVLNGLGPFSIDIVLPAFFLMSHELGTTIDYVQLVVPVYLFFTGISQLFSGIFSDRWGRRVVLLLGLVIFILGSVLVLFCTTVGWVLVGRAFQGLGGGCGPVIARAILRDLFQGKKLAHAMSVSMTIFSLAPLIAPLIGSVILIYFSWKYIFVSMAVMGCALVSGLWFIPETLSQKNFLALSKSYWWKAIKEIFFNLQSRFFIVLSGFSLVPILLIVMTEARVYETNFGIKGIHFSILFGFQGLGVLLGQTLNRFLIQWMSVTRIVFYASGLVVINTAILFGASLGNFLNAYTFCLCLMIFFAAHLIVVSNAASKVLESHGKRAGLTSSFYGFYVQLFATGIVILLSWLIQDHLGRWSGTLFLITLVMFLMVFIWMRFESGKRSELTQKGMTVTPNIFPS